MNNKYKPTIGLEIHAELKTKTKMFCDSLNDPEEKTPNINICPVCMAHPGTLPVINKEAVKHVIKTGVAVGGKIATFTEFDRKNYFYPDIPKGYQISQYKYPIVSGGSLLGFEITRIHLEEDTARSSHDKGEYSLVDFNRAGIPLMELVTEPVIKSAKDAGNFARELQLLLRTLGVSDANMEKGEMRVEANISVSKDNKFGTKVEIKNLNSFKVVEKAIAYEIERHIQVLEEGGELVQETRGWDEKKQVTFSQRIKETSEDYRYFPDPDLPKLKLDEVPEFNEDKIRKELPELPRDKRKKYKDLKTAQGNFALNPQDIEMYIANKHLGNLFDETIKIESVGMAPLLVSGAISTTIAGFVSKHGENGLENITPIKLAKAIEMFSSDKLSSSARDEVLETVFLHGGDPQAIAKEKKLLQIKDEGVLKDIVDTIIKRHSDVVKDYKKGKESALNSLIGQGMKETKGSADPQLLEKLLKEAIG